MNSRFWTLAGNALIALSGISSAQATTVLDTFPVTPGTFGIGWNINYDQDIGVSFSTSSSIVVNSFVAAMGGTGTYRFGVQGTTTTSNGLVPSSSFIHSATILNPQYDASLSGLNWLLPAGNYYFVIQAESFPSDGGWRFGTGGLLSWNGNNAGWNAPSSPAVALRLDGTMAPIPEPTTAGMLLAGLALLVATRCCKREPRSLSQGAA